jgi:hypothetical protein
MLAIVITGTKNRAPKRAAIEVGGVLFERVWFSEGVGMERLNLDAGDKKRGIGHMIVGVHGVQWVLKAAAKTAETSGRCP